MCNRYPFIISLLGKLIALFLVGPSYCSPPAGPLFHQFELTLSEGERTEIVSPFYYYQQEDTVRTWAVPPLLSYTLDTVTDFAEFDFLYPLLTYDRFGSVYRVQLMQWFSFAGGEGSTETNLHRFTLFPLYFQQRSDDNPERDYTALVPFYGTLKGRMLRDEVRFVMMPIYVRSRKRDVVTYNYVYPIFHLRWGEGLRGWQFWPLAGHEHKEVTVRTNMWDELETVAGHDKRFALWPIYFNHRTGLGTANPSHQHAILPLYSVQSSALRDSFTAPWPLGLTRTDDREKGYVEWGAPWPFIVFARGPGKTTSRVWPFFSQARTETLQKDFYAWPIYSTHRIQSAPLDRRRTRLLFFLYSDLVEANTETGQEFRRRDLWPLFTRRTELDGRERVQVLAILEPILPSNKSILRDYSQLWSIWRAEFNPNTGRTSQSLLWNLYRRETAPYSRKCSLLFGLFQYQSGPDGRRARVFYLPMGRSGQ